MIPDHTSVAEWATVASAVLTALTALLALRIAGRQAETSRRQLNVDLYHLRAAIYDKVANAEAALNLGADLSRFIDEMKALVPQAGHLFGPHLKRDLTDLIDALIDFQVHREHGESDERPTLLERVHEIRRIKRKLIVAMSPKVNLHNTDDATPHPLVWLDDLLDWIERR